MTGVDWFLHLDKHLEELVAQYDTTAYLLLFAVVFCETGLVVTPFLPGDSLLFAAGAWPPRDGSIRICSSDYSPPLPSSAIPSTTGWGLHRPKAFTGRYRFLRKEYRQRTHRFYERHGGKTIILARFIPIIRTFAPFVASIAP